MGDRRCSHWPQRPGPRSLCQPATFGLVITDRMDLTSAEFAAATGWQIESEGACKGDVCVPLGGAFDIATATERLGMAVVHDDEVGLWAIGPESFGGRALASAQAPELVLPDTSGEEFRVSSLRGRKVVIAAWAPY